MGYIPPVRDSQSFVYGNRLIKRRPSIEQPFPVYKGQFSKLSKEEYQEDKQPAYYYSNLSKKQMKARQIESAYTDKGFHIDEVV